MIERSIAWLFGYRRLTIQQAIACDDPDPVRTPRHLFCAFLTLAAVLTCYKKLAKAK